MPEPRGNRNLWPVWLKNWSEILSHFCRAWYGILCHKRFLWVSYFRQNWRKIDKNGLQSRIIARTTEKTFLWKSNVALQVSYFINRFYNRGGKSVSMWTTTTSHRGVKRWVFHNSKYMRLMRQKNYSPNELLTRNLRIMNFVSFLRFFLLSSIIVEALIITDEGTWSPPQWHLL